MAEDGRAKRRNPALDAPLRHTVTQRDKPKAKLLSLWSGVRFTPGPPVASLARCLFA